MLLHVDDSMSFQRGGIPRAPCEENQRLVGECFYPLRVSDGFVFKKVGRRVGEPPLAFLLERQSL